MCAAPRGWRCGSAPTTSTSAATTPSLRRGCGAGASWSTGGSRAPSRPGSCVFESDIALLVKRDPAAARAGAAEALELARTVGDADVEVVALAMLGSALIACGDVEEGLRAARAVRLARARRGVRRGRVAGVGVLPHRRGVRRRGGLRPRRPVVRRAALLVRDLARAAVLRHLPHGLRRGARRAGRLVRGRGRARSAMDDLGATRSGLAAAPRCGWGAARAPGQPRRGARAVREGAADAAGDPGDGELDLEAGDATAAAEAAERVLRRLRRRRASTGSRRSSCSPARAPPAATSADARRGRGRRRARGRAPRHAVHARARRTGPGRRLTRPATTTARGEPPRMRSTSSLRVSALRGGARTAAARAARSRRSAAASGRRPRRAPRARRSRCSGAGRSRTTAAGPS